MSFRCDLHTHSTASDGVLSPEALVEEAARAGVGALALTDHDTVAGVPAAQRRGSELGVEVIGGVEISVVEEEGRRQLHVLGLGVDPAAPGLDARLDELAAARRERGAEIVRRLRALGVELALERVLARAGGDNATIGRPHVARALVDAGRCRTIDEAFDRWLGRGRPAFVPSAELSAFEAIALIHRAGGVASLAHPLRSVGVDAPGGLAAFVSRLVRQGLDALELWHPGHGPSERKRIRGQLNRFDLLATGGSDFHGDDPEIALGRGRGNVDLGREVWDALCKARSRYSGASASAYTAAP